MNWGPENIWLIAVGGFSTCFASVMYMMGGTTPWKKWIRRYLGTFLLSLCLNLIAFINSNWHWQYLLTYPFLVLGFSLSYGDDIVWKKILKRSVFVLGCLLSSLVCLWAIGFSFFGWIVFGLQFIIGLGSIILGVINPYNNAPLEQYLISQLLTLFFVFWPFIR